MVVLNCFVAGDGNVFSTVGGVFVIVGNDSRGLWWS